MATPRFWYGAQIHTERPALILELYHQYLLITSKKLLNENYRACGIIHKTRSRPRELRRQPVSRWSRAASWLVVAHQAVVLPQPAVRCGRRKTISAAGSTDCWAASVAAASLVLMLWGSSLRVCVVALRAHASLRVRNKKKGFPFVFSRCSKRGGGYIFLLYTRL